MNKRGFIYGLLATPFAALFARFKRKPEPKIGWPVTKPGYAFGGIIPTNEIYLHPPHCCGLPLPKPLAEKLLAEHKKTLYHAVDVTYTTPTGIHNERHFLPLKPIAPMGEPRSFKYPFGSIPWKPKDDDRA